MTKETTTIPWDEFVEDYSPLLNHLDNNASCDGFMFETYGEELNHVLKQPKAEIWTILDCDGDTVISSGYHIVNRLGYILTAVARPPSSLCIEVVDD